MCTSPYSSQGSTAHRWWVEAIGRLRQRRKSSGMVTTQWCLPQSYIYCPLIVSSRPILDHLRRNDSTLCPETLHGLYVTEITQLQHCLLSIFAMCLTNSLQAEMSFRYAFTILCLHMNLEHKALFYLTFL